jgi:hypothetical protein
MTEKSTPTVQELAAMPENEFLELCRDCDRMDSEYAFKDAAIHALGALGNGAMATAAAFSSAPLAPIGMVLGAVLAGVSVWKGIQEIGKGVQSAARSSSADTILKVLYASEPPETTVKETEPMGRIASAIIRGVKM